MHDAVPSIVRLERSSVSSISVCLFIISRFGSSISVCCSSPVNLRDEDPPIGTTQMDQIRRTIQFSACSLPSTPVTSARVRQFDQLDNVECRSNGRGKPYEKTDVG